jgi:serine/threonine protein kinase
MAQQKAVGPAVDEVDDLIDELQPGAKLLKGQYTITRYINSGGFGITYLAKDSLDRDVVIKECFPSSVCRRSKVVVAARSRAHTAELRSIVQLFVREARSLAKIVHPNIVAVHQVFEDNGTAYMAIDFIDGLDLQQVIEGEGEPLTPEHLVTVTEKLLNAVGFIHENDMLHRDISPDNVLIDKSGEPILIDFGAAREKASQTNRAMSALRVVKDGYSPQEFYIAGSEQGPWSDLYALGATIYHLISGEAPVNGQARLAALAEDRPDPYVPLAGRFTGYPKGFLEAIDRALRTLPKQRLQSAREWIAMFRGGPVGLAAPDGVDDAVHRLVSESQIEASVDQVASAAAAGVEPPVVPKRVSTTPESVVVPASAGKRGVQLAAGIAAALVVVAGGYMMLSGGKDPAVNDETAVVVAGAAVAPTTAGSAETTAPVEPTNTATVDETASTAAVGEATVAPQDPVTETTSEAGAEPDDQQAAATAPADTTVAVIDPADTAAAVIDPADTASEPTVAEPETAVVEAEEPVATETETAAPEPAEAPEAAEEPTVEVATEALTAETPAETAAVPADETTLATQVGTPSANQIAFAAWDVEMPFIADNRIVGTDPVAVVLRIPPKVNLQEAGNWLQPGTLIYSVNGVRTNSTDELTLAVMNAMQVDPDGKARVVVEYAGASLERQTGLLTVTAVRLVNLANGISVRTTVVDGVWQTEVTGVAQPEMASLRQGDILFRDKSTAIALDGPTSLESILAGLVEKRFASTEFAVIRDNKVTSASMMLVSDGGQ